MNCPACDVSLTVPENLAAESIFDDLFDDNDFEFNENLGREDHPNTIHDESELDTGLIESLQNINVATSGDSSLDLPQEPAANTSDNPAERTNDENPFDYDESKPLRIDGITDDIRSPSSFYMRCPVCRSNLQLNENQIGQHIECSDCYSQIPVVRPEPPKKKKDLWRQPAEMKDDQQSDEIQLAPPVDLPEVEPGMGLDEVNEDLLRPLPVVNDEAPPKQQKKKTHSSKRTKPDLERQQKKPLPKVRARRVKANEKAAETNSIASQGKPFSWKQILDLQLAQDLDLIIRTIVTIVFLTFAYSMVDYVWQVLAREDSNGLQKFGEYFTSAFGAFVCVLVAGWFLAVTFSVVMRSVANGDKKVEEWVGFAPSEWLGNFLVVMVSCWASLLPGVLLGFLLYKLTNLFFLLPFLASISAFALMPLFVISSFRNESAINIFSPDVIQTFSSESKQWIDAYKMFAATLGLFFVSIVVLWLPGFLFCLLGASLQVVAVTIFSILVGLLARGLVSSS